MKRLKTLTVLVILALVPSLIHLGCDGGGDGGGGGDGRNAAQFVDPQFPPCTNTPSHEPAGLNPRSEQVPLYAQHTPGSHSEFEEQLTGPGYAIPLPASQANTVVHWRLITGPNGPLLKKRQQLAVMSGGGGGGGGLTHVASEQSRPISVNPLTESQSDSGFSAQSVPSQQAPMEQLTHSVRGPAQK